MAAEGYREGLKDVLWGPEEDMTFWVGNGEYKPVSGVWGAPELTPCPRASLLPSYVPESQSSSVVPSTETSFMAYLWSPRWGWLPPASRFLQLSKAGCGAGQ